MDYRPRRKKSMSTDWNLQIFQHNLQKEAIRQDESSKLLRVQRKSSSPRTPKPIALLREFSDIIYVQVPSIKKDIMVVLPEVEKVTVSRVIKSVKEVVNRYKEEEGVTVTQKLKFQLFVNDKPLESQELIISHLRNTKYFTLVKKDPPRPFLDQIKQSSADVKRDPINNTKEIPKIIFKSYENLASKMQPPRLSRKKSLEQVDALNKKVKEMEMTIKSLCKKDYGDIEFIKDIGKGAAGQVKSCYVNGWICALKEINFDDSNKLDILSEIDIYSRLPAHKNLVRYLGHNLMSEDRKIQLFIKQYSGSLRDQIVSRAKREKYFEPQEIYTILLQIVRGLIFLHNNNVIHRDLKSENIFVQTNKSDQITTCAIGDLGTAKYLSNAHKAKTVIGTAAFIAPEVLNSDNVHSYTTQADVYSFGMIVFELLTLRLPYEELSKSFQITHAVLEGIPPALPELDPKYNLLVELFNRCTQFIPQKRPTPEGILTEFENLVPTKKSNSF